MAKSGLIAQTVTRRSFLKAGSMKLILTPTKPDSWVVICSGSDENECKPFQCEFNEPIQVEVDTKQRSVLEKLSGEHYTIKPV